MRVLMFVRVQTGAVVGVSGQSVQVEAYSGRGLPGIALIGLAKGAAKESLVRVKAALKSLNCEVPTANRVFNLLPAELPKEASALDLPLAIAWLVLVGVIPESAVEGRCFFGSLSLDGRLESVPGTILVADLARALGCREVVVPGFNAAEASLVSGVSVLGAEYLGEVVDHLTSTRALAAVSPPPAELPTSPLCLTDVVGQARAKRALEVAAAGGHNLLLAGPPGAGKSMLAKRLPTLLPPLSGDEQIEVTRIQSTVQGVPEALVRSRPFRAPHHSASDVALCGGGAIPRPGEVTLAHRGVLFLDELPEFSRRSLDALREPLEEGVIWISRAAASVCLPAEVMLIAAMNPCPCGYYRMDGGGSRLCMCPVDRVRKYQSRISGPLLDRIDLQVAVDGPSPECFFATPEGETSRQVQARVVRARQRQAIRMGEGRINASLTSAELKSSVRLSAAAEQTLVSCSEHFGLSLRAMARVIKVAQTIADLQESDGVDATHVEEAASFRFPEVGAALNSAKLGGQGPIDRAAHLSSGSVQ